MFQMRSGVVLPGYGTPNYRDNHVTSRRASKSEFPERYMGTPSLRATSNPYIVA